VVTDEDTKAAYDRAAALDARSPEGREAWSAYWGLVETRQGQLRIVRGERSLMSAVPTFEDTITALLKLYDEEDQQRAHVISTLPLVITDGEGR
jgi:hypothetical protein